MVEAALFVRRLLTLILIWLLSLLLRCRAEACPACACAQTAPLNPNSRTTAKSGSTDLGRSSLTVSIRNESTLFAYTAFKDKHDSKHNN